MVKLSDFQFHPACLQFPDYSKADLQMMVDSMRKHGFREQYPIMRTNKGRVVDGRQRLRAAISAGMEPVFVGPSQEIDDGNETAIIEYVIDANIVRRSQSKAKSRKNLKSLLAMIVVRTPSIVEPAKKSAARRMRAGKPDPTEPNGLVPEGAGQWSETVAAKVNIDEKTLRQADAVNREAPDLAKKVMEEGMSVKEAHQQLRNRKNGTRAAIFANAAIRRANEILARVDVISQILDRVDFDAVRGDESLHRSWLESIDSAISALRSSRRKLENG